MKKSTIVIFWILVGLFIIIIGQFFIPAVRDLMRGPVLFLTLLAAFGLIGIALLISALKEKTEGKLKKFLLLTGASAAGFFVFVLLHNLVYGLFIFFFGEGFWERVGIGDEPLFFLLAIIVCPIGFLVGAIGTIVMLVKKQKQG